MPIEPVSDHLVICDDGNSERCYRQQVIPNSTAAAAREEAERQGWHFEDSWWRDSCPECWPATKARREKRLTPPPRVEDMPTMSYVNSLVSSSPPTGEEK